MAAANVFTVDEANWRPQVSGKSNLDIDQVTAITVNEAGQFQNFFGDGQLWSSFGWIENYSINVTVTSANLSLVGPSVTVQVEVGDDGLLILEMPKRSEGIGGQNAAAAQTLRYYIGGPHTGSPNQNDGCIITSVPVTAQQQGAGSANFGFGVTSMDGTTSPIAISMDILDEVIF